MLLKELTDINAVSGNEDRLREYIYSAAQKYADQVTIDSLGNVIAFKKGTLTKHKIMLSAHMDEVGFIVTGYSESGAIKFKNVGGIDSRILLGKNVWVGESKIPGIIGVKPIHLQEKDERTKNTKMSEMYIDIGTGKRERTEKIVSLGDYISFRSDYLELGDCIKAKALDDRVGCYILLDALKHTYSYDLYACFTVQEEVGLRGAETAAYSVNPDLAFVVEGTTCADVPDVEEFEYSTLLGKGAALTIMDRTTYATKNLVDFIYKTAVKNKIDVQFKQTTTGGNDAGSIHLSRSGIKVASISVPCRYIHSPVSMMSKKDFESTANLVKAVLNEMSINQTIIDEIMSGGYINV